MSSDTKDSTRVSFREVDRWPEDDYEVVLFEAEFEEYHLFMRRPGQPDRDVTGDTDAYARRIKQLVQDRESSGEGT